jgi:hypothetical protein
MMKKQSAIRSIFSSRSAFLVLIEIKEKIDETVSSKAIIEVNSSMSVPSVLLEICSEVIMKRQNPRRFAEVLRICWEVLLAKTILCFNFSERSQNRILSEAEVSFHHPDLHPPILFLLFLGCGMREQHFVIFIAFTSDSRRRDTIFNQVITYCLGTLF